MAFHRSEHRKESQYKSTKWETPMPGCPYKTNGDKTAALYVCRWFFLNDEALWSPLAPDVGLVLTELAESPSAKSAVSFGEYLYDSQELFSMNVTTKRKRPLMFIRSDGYAVTGRCLPLYQLHDETAPGNPPVVIPFEGSERLEEAISEGKLDCKISLGVGRGHANNLEVQLQPPITENVFSASRISAPDLKLKLERCVPTCFVMTESGLYKSYDSPTTKILQLALRSGHSTLRDREYEYDLEFSVQRAISNGESRTMILAQPLTQLQVKCDLTSSHPLIHERLFKASSPTRTVPELLAAIKASPPTQCSLDAALALMNVLLQRFHCVVKGGILRDSVVHGLNSFKDIDVEMPKDVSLQTWKPWCEAMVKTLCDDYGCAVATNTDPISTRESTDIFSNIRYDIGIIIIKLEFPNVELEMVPAWNLQYHPPRNVDFSVNNLRLEPTSPCELKQNVPLGYSVLEVITQILLKNAVPVYDVEWVSGKGNESGEGSDNKHWVQICSGLPHFRKVMMQRRLDVMRKKGYKFVER
eukprot:PhF_6_TR40226/c0_g1_i1/m.59789